MSGFLFKRSLQIIKHELHIGRDRDRDGFGMDYGRKKHSAAQTATHQGAEKFHATYPKFINLRHRVQYNAAFV
jgi:hypothetical protein